MKILVVGAGATGGYIGARLTQSGRDVTFLVRPTMRDTLARHGIRIQTADSPMISVPVQAITTDEIHNSYDTILLAVRNDAVPRAIEDFSAAVGPESLIIPVINGVAHLNLLVSRFGAHRVCGGSAKMVTSLDGGVVRQTQPGVTIEIGRIDSGTDDALTEIAHQLSVSDVTATVSDNIVDVMWTKFVFITATAALTCLLRSTVGPIAQAPGGTAVADEILGEVVAVVRATGRSVDENVRTTVRAVLTDPTSAFAPSMFRDLSSGRPVEVSVLGELAALARAHAVATPLLDAALVSITVHNARDRESPDHQG